MDPFCWEPFSGKKALTKSTVEGLYAKNKYTYTSSVVFLGYAGSSIPSFSLQFLRFVYTLFGGKFGKLRSLDRRLFCASVAWVKGLGRKECV
ncbi:hypothetical protein MRB53_008773 [Persea americana]|uniref:Uncharacterized protein n=1 Tax=Persea americana TaxID=3435 RepID=A0ACC2LN95_PERAE|nr:hypothetical protein MRB53_008773 [Persea americana]